MSLSFKGTKQTGMKQENISILPSSTVKLRRSHFLTADQISHTLLMLRQLHTRSHPKVPDHEAPLGNRRSGVAHPARAAEREIKKKKKATSRCETTS